MAPLTRRDVLLAGGSAALLAGCDTAPDTVQFDAAMGAGPAVHELSPVDIYIPGYVPDQASYRGVPVLEHARMRRAIPKGYSDNITLLTKFGSDGTIRQALFPVRGHDIAVSPDKRTGIFGAMEGQSYVAFDPRTLDRISLGQPYRKGWIGGGHGAFLGNDLVALTERAPKTPYSGRPSDHYGHVTLRDPRSMKIVGDFSTHGISPHEIRLLDDGVHAAIANYGSTVAPGDTAEYGVPRHIVEASITIVEIESGKLVEKYLGNQREELRHLCASDRKTIFAIQAQLVRDDGTRNISEAHDKAHGPAPKITDGAAWAVAPTLWVDPRAGRLEQMGKPDDHKLMRQGLSIEHETMHDEVIASYPSSHTVLIFDATSGHVKHRIECERIGLPYPCGIALLPGQNYYVVAGYWQNLYVFERGTHRLMQELSHHPINFGHSHIVAA